MDPCVLADTGSSQVAIITIGASLFAVSLFIFVIQKKIGVKTLPMLVALLLGIPLLLLGAHPAYAQSIGNDCLPGSSQGSGDGNDGDGGGSGVLGLVDDQTVMMRPNDSNRYVYEYIPLLMNDSATDDDPLDWTTVDLDPDTPGRQTEMTLYHPDSPDGVDYPCVIGNITVGNFGVLEIDLHYSCWWSNDDPFDEGELIIPADYEIPPFTYTAYTESGQLAPEPATVTIVLNDSVDDGEVTALPTDVWSCGMGAPITGYDLAGDVITVSGTIDLATFDLDPASPGIQSSVTVEIAGVTYTAEVDSSGMLSLDSSSGILTADPIFYYTVQNTNGVQSNLAPIIVTNPCT